MPSIMHVHIHNLWNMAKHLAKHTVGQTELAANTRNTQNPVTVESSRACHRGCTTDRMFTKYRKELTLDYVSFF